MHSEEDEQGGRVYRSLALVVLALVGGAALLLATTAPFDRLLGNSRGALIVTYHGLSAGLLVIASAIAVYLGWRLYSGQIKAFRDLQRLSVVVAALSFITILFGNWIYIDVGAPNGVRAYLLATDPALEKVVFEFKESIALFTLPLSVAAAYILARYGEQLLERPWLRASVAVLLALAFVFFVAACGLGAAITQVKPV